ncbi:beta-ketoacyl synthase N-terminal-like domain-containing protein [Actinomadura sp. DC4]|uniref:beta-ketoacyl synthase N-terminal-like domain-containing protein n=1 Tax=Actinomadura sp. DC4 TaxID=3055069 RepID=UPI0025AF9BC9|nr:beta-ketoacyl synthase N-terminal-like domain-containing protein [Actinomadura sp. DC4]MDN3355771.1 beta-ketoacyl synthase N-terminal-like domain-containing protein [Actinomadura sp. DC4]
MSNGPGVALTGMGVLTSIAGDAEEFSRALRAGRSGIIRDASGGAAGPLRDFRPGGWARDRLPRLDAAEVARVSARTALPAATGCCVAAQALCEAGLTADERARTALVVAGNNFALDYQYKTALAHHASPRSTLPSHVVRCMDTDVVGAISEATGVRAEGWTIGGASASGTLALIAATRLLLAGDAERCLVVAPAAEFSPAEIQSLRMAGALAEVTGEEPGEVCRPFDVNRRGFVLGQGAAAVVLEHPDDARRRGAEVVAELRGHGQLLDGNRGTEPDTRGQVQAMSAALDRAGLGTGEIDYVNAHGTGSKVGDPSEAAALLSVFGSGRPPWVNSTKVLLGHCLSAAGLLDAVATAVQLRDGFLHPNPNLCDPLEDLGFVGRTTVEAGARTALSNSFAIGGMNASIVLVRETPLTGPAVA